MKKGFLIGIGMGTLVVLEVLGAVVAGIAIADFLKRLTTRKAVNPVILIVREPAKIAPKPCQKTQQEAAEAECCEHDWRCHSCGKCHVHCRHNFALHRPK